MAWVHCAPGWISSPNRPRTKYMNFHDVDGVRSTAVESLRWSKRLGRKRLEVGEVGYTSEGLGTRLPAPLNLAIKEKICPSMSSLCIRMDEHLKIASEPSIWSMIPLTASSHVGRVIVLELEYASRKKGKVQKVGKQFMMVGSLYH